MYCCLVHLLVPDVVLVAVSDTQAQKPHELKSSYFDEVICHCWPLVKTLDDSDTQNGPSNDNTYRSMRLRNTDVHVEACIAVLYREPGTENSASIRSEQREYRSLQCFSPLKPRTTIASWRAEQARFLCKTTTHDGAYLSIKTC